MLVYSLSKKWHETDSVGSSASETVTHSDCFISVIKCSVTNSSVFPPTEMPSTSNGESSKQETMQKTCKNSDIEKWVSSWIAFIFSWFKNHRVPSGVPRSSASLRAGMFEAFISEGKFCSNVKPGLWAVVVLTYHCYVHTGPVGNFPTDICMGRYPVTRD